MEPMQPLCKVQVHEGGEATGFEKLQVPEFVGFGLVDTRGLHNSQRISWNLNKSLDSLCSGGGQVVPKRHVSCCFQWKKFEFSLRISRPCFLVFSEISQFGLGNDVQYKAATAYHPQRYLCIICGVFGWCCHRQDYVREKMDRCRVEMDWQRFGTERRWASDGGMMCIYNCIFVIICMTFYEDDYVYYTCE